MKYKILEEYKSKDDCMLRLLKRGIFKKDYKLYVKLGFIETTVDFEDMLTAEAKFKILEKYISKTDRNDYHFYPRTVLSSQTKTYDNDIELIRREISVPYNGIYYNIKIEYKLNTIDFFIDNEPDSVRLFEILEWVLDNVNINKNNRYYNTKDFLLSKEELDDLISSKTFYGEKDHPKDTNKIEETLEKIGFKDKKYRKYNLEYGTIRKCIIDDISYISTNFNFYYELYVEENKTDSYFDYICEYWKNIQSTKQPDFINRHPDHIEYKYLMENEYKSINLYLIKIHLAGDLSCILDKYKIDIINEGKPTTLFFDYLEDAYKCYNLINKYWMKVEECGKYNNTINNKEKKEEEKMAEVLRKDNFDIGDIELWATRDSKDFSFEVRLFFSNENNTINSIVGKDIESFTDAYDLYKDTLKSIKDTESELKASIYKQTYHNNQNECSDFKKKKDKGGNRNDKISKE